MAVRLPGPDDVARQRLVNQRGVVDVPVDPMGKVFENLGQMGAKIASDIQEQRLDNEVLRADTRARAEMETARREIEEGDDPANFEANWNSRVAEILKRHGETIPHPRYREVWTSRMQPSILDGANRAREIGQQRIASRAIADSDALGVELETVVGDFGADPERRTEARARYNGMLDRLVERRILRPDQAEARRQQFNDNTLTKRREGIRGHIYERLASNRISDLQGTLADLRNDEGPYAELDPDARGQLIRQAANQIDAERERQAARARAQFNVELGAQERLISANLPVPNPISVERVRAVNGEAAARAWDLTLRSSVAHSGMATRKSSDLVRVALAPRPTGNDVDAILNAEAARTAAERILKQRRDDPRGYLLQQGVATERGLMQAFDAATRSGDYSDVGLALAVRGVEARQGADTFGMPAAPLTAGEAEEIRSRVAGMNSAQRAAFFRSAASGLGRGDAYRTLIQQVLPTSPASAAGAAAFAHDGSVAGVTAQDAGNRFLRGAELLSAGRRGGEGGAGGAEFKFEDGVEQSLRNHWQGHIGARGRNVYAGDALAEAADYEAFRAYYAALKEQRNFRGWDDRAAREAASVTTGNIAEWNGRRTMLPFGVSQPGAERAFRSTWPALQRMHTGLGDFNDYEFVASGQDREGRTIYTVYEGDRPVLGAGNRVVRVLLNPADVR